jgi:hypothetical protein
MESSQIIDRMRVAVGLLEDAESLWARAENASDRGNHGPHGQVANAQRSYDLTPEERQAIFDQAIGELLTFRTLADQRRPKRDYLRKIILDNVDTVVGIAKEKGLLSDALALLRLRRAIIDLQRMWPDAWPGGVDATNNCVPHTIVAKTQDFLELLELASKRRDIAFIPHKTAFPMLGIDGKDAKQASKIMDRIRSKAGDNLKSEKRGNQWWYEPMGWGRIVQLIQAAGGVDRYADDPEEIATRTAAERAKKTRGMVR